MRQAAYRVLVYLLWLFLPASLLLAALVEHFQTQHLMHAHFLARVAGPLLAGALAIFVGLALIRSEFDEGTFRDVARRGHHFFVEHGRAAMLIGGGFATMFVALFFYFPPQEGPAERFAAIAGIYTGVLAVFITAQIFYDRVGPITTIDGLLRSLTSDLKNHCSPDTELWVVYPQPNIGHFRYLSGKSASYSEFETALTNAITRSQNAHFVTIELSEREAYWTEYLRTALRSGNGREAHLVAADQYVSKLVKKAGDLITKLTTDNGKHMEVEASNFPPHAIVIGNISYQISTYGLPMSVNGKFIASTDQRSPAHVVAYRRTDSKLASSIIDDTTRFVGAWRAATETAVTR
jgi:hypothetical protein